MAMRSPVDPFGALAEIDLAGQTVKVSRLAAVEAAGLGDLARLPYSIRVLLENALRSASAGIVTEAQVRALAAWDPQAATRPELPFMPSRVVLQDFTGVPCVVDLAAMRAAVARRGGDPAVINPTVPVDLVIDHSVQVDRFGTQASYATNVRLEMERNVERYGLLRWAQQEFCDLRVVPPGMGIVHQINLEFLAPVVRLARTGDELWAYPDTVIGTDSHTTMINGLGVLGWGVGGIEAEAVMLGQPYGMLVPQVVGVRLLGSLPAGATATDLVLSVTSLLRGLGVVGRFVEYFGPGLAGLSLPDRATIANMSPEYGATVGYFPVDEQTLAYLRLTGRPEEHVRLVDEYYRLQRLYREAADPEPEYSQVVELDLRGVRPSVAGPRRPQDVLALDRVPQNFLSALPAMALAGGRADTTVCSAEVCLVGAHEEVLDRLEGEGGRPEGERFEEASAGEVEIPVGREKWITLKDGAVVIAAITSCTNTSNPSVMIGAGLLARNAVRRGLSVAPWVKTSLAPGSRVVTGYLERSGLLPYLEALHFQIVGYGCTTCIGNSGPLNGPVARAIRDDQLVVASVLSGNRNFEGRIHPLVRANYLMSPALVVAYALAGNVDVDLVKDPLGFDPNGAPVYLRDVWPSDEEVKHLVETALDPELARERYSTVFAGDVTWQELAVPRGALYAWQESSTYVKEPPFFDDFDPGEPALPADILGARLLCHLRGLGHHRPHLARRLDPAGLARRSLPGRRRRGPGPLQHLRRPARQPRGDDARHLREPAPPQPDGRAGGRLDRPPALGRAPAHLRRRDALRRGGGALGRRRGQGVRHRQLPRLGGQGPQPAGGARRPGGELRAHPPQQPGGHGHPAPPVPAGHRCADVGADRRRGDRRAGVGRPPSRRRGGRRHPPRGRCRVRARDGTDGGPLGITHGSGVSAARRYPAPRAAADAGRGRKEQR